MKVERILLTASFKNKQQEFTLIDLSKELICLSFIERMKSYLKRIKILLLEQPTQMKNGRLDEKYESYSHFCLVIHLR